MKKRILILLILVAVLAGGVAYYLKGETGRDQPSLTFSGTIETTQVELSFLLPGRVEELLVDEGHSVEYGQVVARLDRRALLEEEKQAEANLEAAQARIVLTKTSLALERDTVHADLRAAEATAGEAAHNQLFWQKEWDRIRELFRQGAVPARTRDETRRALDAASDELKVARARVDQAKAQLLRVDRLEKELLVQEAVARQAEANLGLIREKLDDTILTSALSGVVLVKSVEQGEYVNPGTSVVTVAELTKVWLRCFVNETDLGRVKLGQKVAVTIDSFPGKTYLGRISFISSEAEFTPKNIQTHKERVRLVYRMKVDLDNPDLELKPGLPADGTLLERG